jgi:hypothetical protein
MLLLHTLTDHASRRLQTSACQAIRLRLLRNVITILEPQVMHAFHSFALHFTILGFRFQGDVHNCRIVSKIHLWLVVTIYTVAGS